MDSDEQAARGARETDRHIAALNGSDVCGTGSCGDCVRSMMYCDSSTAPMPTCSSAKPIDGGRCAFPGAREKEAAVPI